MENKPFELTVKILSFFFIKIFIENNEFLLYFCWWWVLLLWLFLTVGLTTGQDVPVIVHSTSGCR